jgi:hypothetical protein
MDPRLRRRRKLERTLGLLGALAVVLTVFLQLTGCLKEMPSPFGIQEMRTRLVSDEELKFISIGQMQSSALGESQLSAVEDARPEETTFLKVWYKDESKEVSSTLFIPKRGVLDHSRIRLSLRRQNLVSEIEQIFGSDGMEFQIPARLGIIAYGLDLERVDPNRVGFYRYIEEQEGWEQLETLHLYVNVESGTVIAYCLVNCPFRYTLAEMKIEPE